MKILLAPAKKMNIANDDFIPKGMPVYLNETKELLRHLKSMTPEQRKKLWKCSDKLAEQNERRLENTDLYNSLSPAIFSYEGLAYQHMSPGTMDEEELEYLQKHLRILSGFYGILRPFDGIVPYRLEMQAVFEDGTNLYDYWGEKLYQELKDDRMINLASKEYSDAVRPYLKDSDHMIDIVFGEKKGNKIITKGTYAKMARGNMVWYMADQKIEDPEELKNFDEGFLFSEEDSDEHTYVFLRKEEK